MYPKAGVLYIFSKTLQGDLLKNSFLRWVTLVEALTSEVEIFEETKQTIQHSSLTTEIKKKILSLSSSVVSCLCGFIFG